MTLYGLHNEQYVTSRELGRGGEGTVYELRSHNNLVVKKYNEPLTAIKTKKLLHMAAMRDTSIATYAAWPVDVVKDDTGALCGFVMKKLSGYVPLHMIFSPMDRKKLFPDKGYNFLVHVARNLATAFHKLHEAGLVVGDVNEGNILISSAGLVAFIDCDSFQVKGDNEYFFCEVGVPRYTPPELLRLSTFEQVVRTVNTDSFSLAVLIFQLLFLGRHPFAGRHKTAADIDEETAIKQGQFAYSLHNKKKKLSPPKDSLDITTLPEDIVQLFHQAFEHEDRPEPAAWVTALGTLLANMATCTTSRIHTYPAGLNECPWCHFRKTRGILYFLDDTYLHAQSALGDIESFVNGFSLNKLEPQLWISPAFSDLHAAPINKRILFYHWWKVPIGLAFVTIACIIALINARYLTGVTFVVAVLSMPLIHKLLLSASGLMPEYRRRGDRLQALTQQLEQLVSTYNYPPDLKLHNDKLTVLQRLVNDFRQLPREFDRRKKLMEERLYTEQLQFFLQLFKIEDHTIPQFGPSKKNVLYSSGIYTAADISKITTMKINGIGPRNQQVLLDWQRQMSADFVYIPDNYRISAELMQVNREMANIKTNLEAAIRKEYQALSYLKQNITNRASLLNTQLTEAARITRQAELDYDSLRQIVKWKPFFVKR